MSFPVVSVDSHQHPGPRHGLSSGNLPPVPLVSGAYFPRNDQRYGAKNAACRRPLALRGGVEMMHDAVTMPTTYGLRTRNDSATNAAVPTPAMDNIVMTDVSQATRNSPDRLRNWRSRQI